MYPISHPPPGEHAITTDHFVTCNHSLQMALRADDNLTHTEDIYIWYNCSTHCM